MRINFLYQRKYKCILCIVLIYSVAVLTHKNVENGIISPVHAIEFDALEDFAGSVVPKHVEMVASGYFSSDESNFSTEICTMETEFFNFISDNPIDKDLALRSDMYNQERIELALKYQKAWKAEIDHSLNVLKEYLTEDDYQLLCDAYQGWETYIQNTITIEAQIFYPSSSYGTGEGITRTLPMEVKAARIRDYAVLLMSLVYEFTGTVEFIYCAELG